MSGVSETDVERTASILVEQAIVAVAIGEGVNEEVGARRVVQAIEAGNFVVVEIDGASPIGRIFGREPSNDELRSIRDEALAYARIIIAWHADRAAAVES